MAGSVESPETHLPLHPLEFEILLTLKGGPAHAYAVVRAITERQPDWSRIQPTNMYRRIWRLEGASLLREVQGPQEEGDTRRKYFEITPLGERVAAAEAGRLRALLRTAEDAGLRPEKAVGP